MALPYLQLYYVSKIRVNIDILLVGDYHILRMLIINLRKESRGFKMENELTHGPVMKTMLRFAIPMILGDLLQQCYNIADTLIVGRFLGADAPRSGGFGLFSDDVPDFDPAGPCHGERHGGSPSGSARKTRLPSKKEYWRLSFFSES